MHAGPRRPGRTQRIAYDATPLSSPTPDIDARIGWLLAMSRLHHPDPAFQDGRQFTVALADAGLAASRSLLSRWESGEIPISYEGMTAYETALGLEPGQISSITGYIRASIPGVKAKVVRPKLVAASSEFADRLDELLDLAEEGDAGARIWQELGWHLAAAPMVHLRAHTWQTLAERIVHLLPRSVKVAYRQYSTAAMNMAAVPRAQDFLVEAIASYVADPDVQVITNPVGLLDRLPTRGAARLVLDLVKDPPNESVFGVGVWLAAQKVARGDFTEEERTELDMLVLRLWRANPARASQDLAELIANLPEGIRSTLVDAAAKAGRRRLGYVVEHGEELVSSKARAIAQELADRARARLEQDAPYDEDRMLPRLIREALFHRDSERRHLAALLISSSPFSDATTDELMLVMADEQHLPWTRTRAATLVRYLGSDVHRMRLLAFLDHPSDDLAVPVTQGLGHLSFTPLSDQALRNTLGRDWSLRERAKMYALGMTGSPALSSIVRSATAPAWQISAARWWLAQGPAIRA
jgi:transcriptional regulator with XRE-family HTH domain